VVSEEVEYRHGDPWGGADKGHAGEVCELVEAATILLSGLDGGTLDTFEARHKGVHQFARGVGRYR